MTSPFLQIFANPPSVVAGISELGSKGSVDEKSGQGDGKVAFSKVLGKTQQVQQQGGDILQKFLAIKGLVKDVFNHDQDILDERVSQELNGVELDESLRPLLLPQTLAGAGGLELSAASGDTLQKFLANEDLVKDVFKHDQEIFDERVSQELNGAGLDESLTSLLLPQTLTGAGGLKLSGANGVLIQNPSVDSPNHPNQLNTLVASAGQTIANLGERVVPEIVEQSPRIFHAPPILDRLNAQPGVVTQPLVGLAPVEEPVVSHGLRARPLLNENIQPIVDARSSTGPVSGSTDSYDANIQRLLSAIEGTGSNAKTNVASSSVVNSVLSPARDELSQSLARVDGEGKTIGTIGSSQSGEAGLGHAGGGLPFGNHPGNGQGQNFDSLPGTLGSASQGQVAAKAGNFDDRLQLLNTSVPHRLQIDVQLSESARVQVDVGVQQRQVYAGVLFDNPVLRALASQNVQELQNQLGQSEMELEEFDVYGDDQQLSEQAAKESFERDNFQGGLTGESGSPSVPQGQKDPLESIKQGKGWHLVA